MSGDVTSYTGDRREFIGRNGTPARPAGALEGRARRINGRSRGSVWSVAAAGDAARRRVVHASRCCSALAGPTLRRARSSRSIVTSRPPKLKWNAPRQSWRDRLTTIKIETPDEAFNRIENGWLLYQALSCRMWGRAALYQSSGAYGFRDQLQDTMAFLYTDAGVAREHILRCTRHQFVEGDVQHWWHEPSGRGVRTRFSDDLVWLPFVVAHYMEVTGDTGVLDERAPFIAMRELRPDEHELYDQPQVSSETANVYEHCVRALERACTFGQHDLPLIGSGDWNDGFSRVGIEGKGVSVWLAWFLIATLRRFAPIAAGRGDTAAHDEMLANARALSRGGRGERVGRRMVQARVLRRRLSTRLQDERRSEDRLDSAELVDHLGRRRSRARACRAGLGGVASRAG